MATPDSAVNTAVNKAIAGWGEAPEWILELARECDSTSVHRAAARLGVSPALVSRAVNNKHHAPLGFLQERLESAGNVTQAVVCPVLGEIPPAKCKEERERPFSGVNPLRVQLARTCPDCILNPKKEKKS